MRYVSDEDTSAKSTRSHLREPSDAEDMIPAEVLATIEWTQADE